MTWSDSGDRAGRRGYHHGNLREALVEAALALIAEKGPAGFTLAEAARQVGVSPAAPYRHFRDGEALLAEVARRGFEHLAASLQEAWQNGRPDPATAFEAVGRAYLNFARTQPAYYAAMFEMRIAIDAYTELATASDRSFAVLRQAVEQLIARIPQPDRPPALMVALHVWALSHGIASLFCRPDRTRRPLPMPPEELLEAGVLLYMQSVGLAGGIPEHKPS
jgi:AcrR family transcriptional regulator